MFQGLPQHERQAFFSLLDEYFDARPHLLPISGGADEAAAATPPPPSARGPPPTTAAKPAPPPTALRATPLAPATPASPAPARKPFHAAPPIPAGLSSGKSIGRMSTASAGSAFGSLVKGEKSPPPPKNPAEAIAGASSSPRSSLPPPARRGPPPPAPAPVPAGLGQGEALFDYAVTEAEDLAVSEGETVDLLERISDDWWKARAKDGSGREGIVPATYIKVL